MTDTATVDAPVDEPGTGQPRRNNGTARGSDYAALSRQIRSAGLLERKHLAYVLHSVCTFAFFGIVCAAMVWVGDSRWQFLLAVALGVAFTQVAFLGHDGGHQQIFASRRANDLFGQITGDLLVGLSFGWWVGKHNRHHANPNKEDHDPDIGDGVLAFTTGQVAARKGRFRRAIARRQAWLFFPLLTLEGVHLHVASVRSLLNNGERSARGGRRSFEATLLVVHAVGYVAGLLWLMSPSSALLFAAIHQAVFGVYMGCSFAPNHRRRRRRRLPAPTGADVPQRARRSGHRLAPRRTELPGRAPFVPEHAALRLAARATACPQLLRRARCALHRDQPGRFLPRSVGLPQPAW
jgi:fatty acid desaturase